MNNIADAFEHAVTHGWKLLDAAVNSGDTITLKKIPAPKDLKTAIPFRYEGADVLSTAFLRNADPAWHCSTGLMNVVVVDHLIGRAAEVGFAVTRTADQVTVALARR